MSLEEHRELTTQGYFLMPWWCISAGMVPHLLLECQGYHGVLVVTVGTCLKTRRGNAVARSQLFAYYHTFPSAALKKVLWSLEMTTGSTSMQILDIVSIGNTVLSQGQYTGFSHLASEFPSRPSGMVPLVLTHLPHHQGIKTNAIYLCLYLFL